MDEKTNADAAGAPGATGATAAHQAGCFVCQTAIPLMGRFWTEATRDHFRSARVEFLKGLRSLIDSRISHLEHAGEETKGTRVTVE